MNEQEHKEQVEALRGDYSTMYSIPAVNKWFPTALRIMTTSCG